MATALNGCPSTSSRHNRETTLQSYFLLFDGMNTNWNVEFTVRPLLVPITLSAFWHSINICIFFLALVAKVKFFLFVSPLFVFDTVLQINKGVFYCLQLMEPLETLFLGKRNIWTIAQEMVPFLLLLLVIEVAHQVTSWNWHALDVFA